MSDEVFKSIRRGLLEALAKEDAKLINETEDLFEWAEYYDQSKDMEEIGAYTSFDSYQEFTDSTAIFPEHKALEYLSLGLTSEAGEVAGKIKKWIRDGVYDEEAIASELGDVLWYVAQLCSTMQLYMSDVAQMNINKLSSRMERGTISGDGDNR